MKTFLTFLLFLLFQALTAANIFCQKKIVILGSSTAAGGGASTYANSWAGLFTTYIKSLNSSNSVINLAVSGYSTYQILPTGTNIPGRPSPDVNVNITAGLAQNPDAIIVNMPTNDVVNNYAVSETENNFQTVVAASMAAGVPIWITTTQPRNNMTPFQISELTAERDWITNTYGTHSIDFWTTIANPDGSINTIYDFGDGVHLNDAGHNILYQRVQAKNILQNLTINYYSKPSGDIGNLSNWGTSNDGSGYAPVSFLKPTYVFNLANRPGTTTLTAPLNFKGQLNVAAAHTLQTNGNLIIKSDANGTGIIGPVSGAITGNVTVERYISAQGNRAYRLLAPSVSAGTIRANWQNGGANVSGVGTHITGSSIGANGFDATPTGQASLFTFDQVAPSQGWAPINNTDANALDAKKGYLLYIRGDRTIDLNATGSPLPSNNTTLSATGSLLTGDQTFSGLESNGRFSLVTNPYASPINWSSIYNDGSNNPYFENYYTYWDPNISSRGSYVTINSSGVNSAGTTATTEIQPGQAFFVKTKSGITSPTLTTKETHKSTTSNIDVFRIGSPETFRIKLFFNDNGTRKLADGAVELFNNDFSAAIDGNDAEKIANFDESIAIARDNKILSIEGRPLVDANDNIPLSIARLIQQPYEWQFEPSAFSASSLQTYLHDKFLNTQTSISLSTPTIVPFTVTADGASSAADRFTVVFSQSSTLPLTVSDIRAYQKANGIQVEWNTLIENNVERYEVEKSINGQQFIKAGSIPSTGNSSSLKTYNWFDGSPNTGSNYYRVRSITRLGGGEYSSIVKVALASGLEKISIYPNPVEGNVIGLQLNNLAKGTYTITIADKLGRKVYSKVIEHQGGSASQTLQTETMAKGIYQ
jgi:lysophospholipase L1-like esterase